MSVIRTANLMLYVSKLTATGSLDPRIGRGVE